MKTNEPIPALALDDLLHMAASAIEDLLEHADPNTSYYSGVWADVPGKLRAAAMLQAGNSPVIPDGSGLVSVPDEFLSTEQNARGMFELSEDCMCRLAVALSQQNKGLVTPPGYVMVPREPTEEMNKAGWAAMNEHDAINPTYRAMIAAAPHETPALNSAQSVVTVSDAWIPVSERMPEVGVKVLCFPVKDEPIHATFNGQLWLQDISWSGSYEPIDNVIPTSVTHWMPLPAAPQEVKGES